MNCKMLHKKLIFYVEEELPELEMQEVAIHLAHCERCAAFAEYLTKTLGIVQQEKTIYESPFFYTRLKVRMEQQQQAINKSIISLAWGKVLQPALFSILLIAGIYSGIQIGAGIAPDETVAFEDESEVIPFLNELKSEPLENFLME